MDKHERIARLAREVARSLAVDHIDVEATFETLGWDSMMVVELAVAAEVVYNERVKFEEVNIPFDKSLQEIFEYIDGLMTPHTKTFLTSHEVTGLAPSAEPIADGPLDYSSCDRLEAPTQRT